MIILLLLILIGINPTDSNHFNGGTINWAPVDRNSTSSLILITVTQYYYWSYPTVSCLTDVPLSTSWTYFLGVAVSCVANCSTDGGYSSHTIDILTDCTSYSASLGILNSQRTVNLTLNESAFFWIAYQSTSWRPLANAATTFFPGWSIVSLINLRRRPDGLINTPPVSQVSSPQYVIVNKTTTIKIPVTDVDINDDLRCRWSLPSNAYGVDECAAVCAAASTKSLASLSGCMLTFTAPTSNVWYAITLQVEDFINTTSTIPLSSVAIQFLIYVLPTPNCTKPPVILPLSSCLDVEINVPINFTLYAMNNCNGTKTIITDILPTISIAAMSAGSLLNSTTDPSLVYVTFTWTPQINQIGSLQFCALAYTSESVQSDPYCVTFTVGTKSCTTTTSTSTTTTSETSTTTTTESTTTTRTTTTSATSTSTTSATTTTETTVTTTSLTTTLETTTITPNSNQPNLLLIVGLPILGLLLILGCIIFSIYYVKRSTAAKHRGPSKKGKNSRQRNLGLPTGGGTTSVQLPLTTKNSTLTNKFKNRKSLNSFQSSRSIETIPALITDNKSINKSVTSSEQDNESIEVYQQHDPNENIYAVDNQSKPQRSFTVVSIVPKSSPVPDNIENNELNKSSIFYYQKNEFVSPSATKMHGIKVPRNKVSAAVETTINTPFSNHNPPAETYANVLVKKISTRNKGKGQADRTSTKIDNNMRRRASSFDGVSVKRVKSARGMDRSFVKHSMYINRSNSGTKQDP